MVRYSLIFVLLMWPLAGAASPPRPGPESSRDVAPAGETFPPEEPVLNVYNWSDYIHPDVIPAFEEEFGIEVNYDLYDATETVEAKLLAGSTGYDVVLHSTGYSSRLIPIGVYQPLDRTRLPLWKNLDPWVLEKMQAFDPGNRYAMPYMWGSTGMAYNLDMVLERMPDAPLDSAAMLYDPDVVSRFADCGVTYLDGPTDVIPLGLQYLGHDPNSLDPAHLAEVEALVKAVRPYIKYFSSAKMMNDLPNEEVCVAMSWSGDYAQARERAREVGRDLNLAYRVPKEGSLFFFDGLFIPADAPHPDNAHTFLNFLLRPEIMAANSDETRYGNAVPESVHYMKTDVATDPAAYPPPDVLARLEPIIMYGPKEERIRTRVYSRIKTGL